MREIGAFEAKNTLSALLDLVETGEEITITRRGKVVARLVPPQGAINREEARAAIQRMRDRAKKEGHGRFDWAEWKAYRDEGRP
jgi:prevent-host-death family protein